MMGIPSSSLRAAGIRVAGAGTTKGRKKRKPTPIVDMKSMSLGGAAFIWLPIRAESEANKREHWAVRKERKKSQQAIVASKRRHFKAAAAMVECPYRITLIRIGPRLMDSDNNAASLKHVQDQVAREIGIDDGDRTKATWEYGQMKQPFYAVRVHIQPAEAQ